MIVSTAQIAYANLSGISQCLDWINGKVIVPVYFVTSKLSNYISSVFSVFLLSASHLQQCDGSLKGDASCHRIQECWHKQYFDRIMNLMNDVVWLEVKWLKDHLVLQKNTCEVVETGGENNKNATAITV